MTNRLVLYITVEESTSIQGVKKHFIFQSPWSDIQFSLTATSPEAGSYFMIDGNQILIARSLLNSGQNQYNVSRALDKIIPYLSGYKTGFCPSRMTSNS